MSVQSLIRERREKPPIEQILLPFQEFFNAEAASGILLLLFTVIALIWANSPWSGGYNDLWHTKLTFGLGDFTLDKPLILWINDGLMAIFFFVVGLEIKREILVGELSSWQQAILPIVAAIGGMIVPAVIYAALNAGQPGLAGWGIPMATDIAFALGILALLGKRVPLSLKIFLTALAIVDDIGAVLVIALFYTAEISWLNLALGGIFLMLMMAINFAGVRHPLVYLLLGIGLWIAFLKSGVHATIAGVLAAMTIPARTRINANEFLSRTKSCLNAFEQASQPGRNILSNRQQRAAVQSVETACQQVESPMQRLEHNLHPWVTRFIMPVFALANAGVALGGDFTTALTDMTALGIIAGLVIGKQVGITLFTWLAVRTGLASLPKDLTWRHIYGVSWLAGIGFTMSLFIASLAFGEAPLLPIAKAGILTGSLIAGTVGWALLWRTKPVAEKTG
jgi:NhaA family Na+:H+ antiporter